MGDGDDHKGAPMSEKERREARLAEALRANLHRRKAQAKSRRAGDGDPRAGIDAAAFAATPAAANAGRSDEDGDDA
ncbi:hypothetical protein [Methylobrevis albus]|uniref:Uncharacterized protein n=1 Tax=Methylobrevis albus TaxID=2793297 RepID=A0A931MX39_9HYPH|nr:hypothetical protein [Methylobrevis albus]MBH0238418.1 hypothetical protein [Methylobrevis albus]